jgi:hypothetical protein
MHKVSNGRPKIPDSVPTHVGKRLREKFFLPVSGQALVVLDVNGQRGLHPFLACIWSLSNGLFLESPNERILIES